LNKTLPLAFVAAACLFGCSRQGPFRHIEDEVNDMKVEVYRQRQEIQALAAKIDDLQKSLDSDMDKDAKFRANTQETLRQIREYALSTSNRLDSGAPRQGQSTRQPTRQEPDQPQAAVQETRPDDQQLALAEKDFNTGNFQGAAEAADNLVKYFPDSDHVPEALYIRGRALYATKSYDRAQESFQRLCDKHPSSPRFRAAKLNIGRCQVSSGNTLAAVATLEDIVRRWPNSPEARSAGDLLQDLKSDG